MIDRHAVIPERWLRPFHPLPQDLVDDINAARELEGERACIQETEREEQYWAGIAELRAARERRAQEPPDPRYMAVLEELDQAREAEEREAGGQGRRVFRRRGEVA